LYRNCSYGRLQAMTHILNNDTPALNALKALRGAPTSMGRVVKFPVELQPAAVRFRHIDFWINILMKEVCPMAENNNLKQNEKSQRANSSLTDTTTYDFDKNSFIVEPVFKTEKSETLGAVLLRLMTQKE